MKNAFIKGVKAWNSGKWASDGPYKEGVDKRYNYWIKGFISAHAENVLRNRVYKRIPKSF